jgi:hypothetical protein
MRKWIHHYESLLLKNKSKFAEISICGKRPQSNESLQITMQLKRGSKAMKNRRPGEIAPKLVKCGGEYVDLFQLIDISFN